MMGRGWVIENMVEENSSSWNTGRKKDGQT